MIQGIAAAFLKVMYYVVAKRLFPNHFEVLAELIGTTLTLFIGVGPFYASGLQSVTSFSVLFVVANLECFVAIFCEVFYTPFLSLKLKNDFDVKEELHGYFFLARAIGGIIGNTPVVFLLRKCFRLSSIISLGSILHLLSYVLFSMSARLGMPHNLGFIWSGMVMNGFGFSVLFTPILPYILDYFGRNKV